MTDRTGHHVQQVPGKSCGHDGGRYGLPANPRRHRSNHTKQALRALCPEGSPGHGNINVMRHPDHNVLENAGDMTFYWV